MKADALLNHVERAIEETMAGQSSLDQATLDVTGFSPRRMRQLYNNLCSPVGFTYLEVGLWCGASFTAACCGNPDLMAYGVDNFAQTFGEQDVRTTLCRNIEAVRPKTGTIAFFDEDCWSMDTGLINQKVDLFVYDGDHAETSQRKALPYFLDRMADTFLFAVDDWNWHFVASGTHASFNDLKDRVRLLRRWVWHTRLSHDPEFHNGLALFLLEKI